jgi:hypothetical protein
LPSLQKSAFGVYVHAPALHRSSVQGFESLQTTGAKTQPVVESQLSTLQASWSSHVRTAEEQWPESQVSTVQASASAQSALVTHSGTVVVVVDVVVVVVVVVEVADAPQVSAHAAVALSTHRASQEVSQQ